MVIIVFHVFLKYLFSKSALFQQWKIFRGQRKRRIIFTEIEMNKYHERIFIDLQSTG